MILVLTNCCFFAGHSTSLLHFVPSILSMGSQFDSEAGCLILQAFLADAEDQRETRRLLRYGMGQAESSSGVRRSGQGRSSAFSRMLNPQNEAASNNVDEERVRFPPTMGLESVRVCVYHGCQAVEPSSGIGN